MRRLLSLLLLSLISAAPARPVSLTGVNLSGGEFGGPLSVYGKGYIYPDEAQMRAFADRGMNIVRVPLRWERLQPVLNAPLNEAELARLDQVVATATGLGLYVIIDIHNYARYARKPLTSQDVTPAALRDLWVRIASHYRNQPKVIFGLMNEPVNISAGDWAATAQATVSGIRGAGATNLVLVPGANWSGAHSWNKKVGGTSNAVALTGFKDPANNMAFDFHQYFDANSSGTSDVCVSAQVAESRLAVATNWLRAINGRGMLTEFGVGRSPDCVPALTAALRHLAANKEWMGWTMWGSSAWFGSYKFNLYPFQTPPPPQLDIIRPYQAGVATK
jgi:endoglucanase